jgi:hypothetical protein
MQEYEEYEGDTHSTLTKFIIPYFAIMAVLMWPANALGWGMMGILTAMAIAAVLLALCVLLFRYIKRKMGNVHLSRRQWVEMMTGVSPSTSVVDAEPPLTFETPREQEEDSSLATRKLTSTAVVVLNEQGLPDRIIENNGLYLSDRFMPDIASFFGQIMLLCGIRRFGKSNLLAVLIEEMAPYHLPMLIVDTEDEYAPLAERVYLSRGFVAGSPDLDTVDLPVKALKIRVCDGYTQGRQIMEQHLQVVLNMKSYETDDEAALVLCELIRGMNDWEQEQQNKDRIPVFLFMDEAPKWLPQDGGRDSCVSKTTQHYLYRTFFGTVVNRGGKQGWGAAFAAQRIQQIHKAVLQAPWKFLFYQTQRVDLEQYKTFGLSPEDVMTLQQGECYIFSPNVIGFRTFMRKRTSPHLGHTPGLEALMAHQKHVKPVGALQFGMMEERQEAEPFHNGIRLVEKAESTPGLSPELDRALVAYKKGYTSINELAAALSVSPWTARQLLSEIKVKELA